MKYLLTIYSDDSRWAEATPQELQQMMSDYEAFTREATAAGVMLGGEGLSRSSTATTVRLRGDEDEAIGWAARMPGARYGAIEVRAVMDYEAVGGETHSREVAR